MGDGCGHDLKGTNGCGHNVKGTNGCGYNLKGTNGCGHDLKGKGVWPRLEGGQLLTIKNDCIWT